MSRPQHPFTVRNKDVWAIALPASLAFITEPVAGVVDTAVIGQLGDAGLLGGLALGTVAFSVIFALAFFLRFGTAGLVAQAVGAHDPKDGLLHLARAMLVAVVLGLALLALSVPVYWFFAATLAPPEQSQAAFADYLFTRLWSVPFVFINYVLLGWFYGRAAAKTGMVLQILINVVNIVLSIAFVFGLGWGVVGVAAATVIGQVCASAIGLVIAVRHYGGIAGILAATPRAALLDLTAIQRMVGISRDLIIRSAALMGAFAFFAAQRARMGEVILSASTILLQLFAISAFFLDGLATATEQLCGRAVGANWRPAFETSVRLSLLWGLVIGGALTIILLTFGWVAIDLMTTNAAVRENARTYLVMAALTPLTGMTAFVYDGIMIGATLNVTMRNGMLASLAIYLATAIILQPLLGLWGLWLALHVLLLTRAGIYAVAIERRKADLFT
ncbi:MATE family efflux transporter [Pelagibacterium xiamenense]|uniref:MATE family efflux transporter n=1 Tax=Pelagibacterium xiamenense TaxID=2901140 RepID=UPI001E42F084|nr:MATE family efflux transporter [Pelagibacterium xiamenense]MCD7059071.1 MATE family efflux transporter [Pelagibacterium xiamenense]